MPPLSPEKKLAYKFIVLMGLVSLFGDITYEGARSITGPYFAVLGGSALAVGVISGLGEFIGYALRLLSGYLADKTKSYWTMTFIGYGLIFAIPFLAYVNSWQFAASFIILERMGKAIRSPSRDAILSHATKQVGRGWGFGLHEALDQIGAVAGPMIFTTVFLLNGSYKTGFQILWAPAIAVMALLIVARMKVPSPETFEPTTIKDEYHDKLPRVFWLYAAFTVLSVAGYAGFQLIAFHVKINSLAPDYQIPILYAIAMAVDAVVALIVGKLYDKIGLKALIAIPLLSLPIPFLGFSKSYLLIVVAVVLWGAVMGVHETIMRAAIADFAPVERRGLAYGVFNTAYGVSMFVGGTLMGLLYEHSLNYLFAFAVSAEVLSLLVFMKIGFWKTADAQP